MYNWPNLESIFSEINNKCNYLVLRNYEELQEGKLIAGHEDIDILCDDAKLFVDTIKGKKEPVDGHFFHYYVSVCNKIIEFGVRTVGDGYYSESWQKDMLKKRKFVNDFCFAMDDENYFYSLIYHAVLHKKIISNDYFERLTEIGEKIDVKLTSKEQLHEIMLLWMKEKNYDIEYPKDISVPFDLKRIGVTEKKAGNLSKKLSRAVFTEPPLEVKDYPIVKHGRWKRRKILFLPVRFMRTVLKKVKKRN